MFSRRLLILLCLATMSPWASASLAADATRDSGAAAETQRAEVETAERLPAQSTSADLLAEIQSVREQSANSTELDEKARFKVIDLCDKAAAKLADAEKLSQAAATLEAELSSSAKELEALVGEAAATTVEAPITAGLSLEELRGQLSAAQQAASTARSRLEKIVAEIEHRASRRQALPDLIAKNRERMAGARESISEEVKEGGGLIAVAERLYRSARCIFLEQESSWLEQESRTYESSARLQLARRDAAERQLKREIEREKSIKDRVARAQRREAERQAQDARRTAATAHPAVKLAAATNAEFAERNRALVQKTQEVQRLLAEAGELGALMKRRLEGVLKRSEAAKNSPVIGAMLRTQQDQLPSLAPFRERLKNRPVAISQLGLDIYEWDSARREVLYIDHAVEQALEAAESNDVEADREGIARELGPVLKARAEILRELISNANDCLSRLEELDSAEREVVATTETLAGFISEQVLWVRSAPTLSLSDILQIASYWDDRQGFAALLDEFVSLVRADFSRRPILWCVSLSVALGLVAGRKRVRQALHQCGEAAKKPTATSFRPTFDAALATMFLAAPAPMLLGFLGWRLTGSSIQLLRASGWALTLFAAAYAMLNLVRHASRAGGLGANHFGWDSKGLAAIRRAARVVQLIALPLLAIAVGTEIAGNDLVIRSIGRLSLVAALLVTGVASYRLFHSSGALATNLASQASASRGSRWIRLVAPLAALSITAVICASLWGYHYTSMQLTRRIFVSCLFVFACLALRSLLMRWLLVSYRRMAMQQAREKRQAMLEAQQNASGETPAVEVEPQVSLSDINQQARKLVASGATLAFITSLWVVWGDLLPALGVFGRVELWASALVPSDPDAVPAFITLFDLLIAVAVFSLTWFGSRNLPGLLEIALLRKLPLDAGARYAASSVTRYAIMVVGVILGMRQLGVGWHSVQWLVAAMTVGLGFGLQEIFANFVSGIILLFERPARVGDTVTIGQITGTITKIRIRATTILDWDNKELVVPNKDFVTGNLVNWTLTSPDLRLVIGVGVAYGSDTRLVTELLYKVANDNPKVLAEPEPVVVFNEFGDNSLNFELRLFVTDLVSYRRLRHDLHLAIDDLFREHHIEIAFPQRDLHIRSVSEGMIFSSPRGKKSRTSQELEEAA